MKTMEQARIEIESQQSKYGKVNSLMQYINKETLRVEHVKQPKGKASGVDEVTKEMYEEHLDENLDKLIERMKTFSYRPLPVRRTYIPNGLILPLPFGIYVLLTGSGL